MIQAFALLSTWLLVTGVTVDYSIADDRIGVVNAALGRWVCHDYYWRGVNYYRLGKSLPVEIKIERDDFFIWIDRLWLSDNIAMAGYFSGRIVEGRAVVIVHEGYNMKAVPPLAQEKRQRYFDGGGVIKEKFTFPADCTPTFDPMTPRKEEMLRALDKTLEQETETFRWYAQLGVKEVTLTVANFNTDYYSTYVWIGEPVDRVYEVNLVFQYYDDFKRLGVFPMGRVRLDRLHMENLTEKIRKHALFVRTISLEGK